MSKSVNRIIGLRAETSIHAGSGESEGMVDLPIMREKHSGWPVVYGSAVKGALRATSLDWSDQELAFALFGPDTTNASDHAGSMLVGDARLLALPVRSLTSQYRLVTCPDLITRFVRDAQRLGLNLPDIEASDRVADGEVLTAVDESNKQLFLEEFSFVRKTASLDGVLRLLETLVGLSVADGREKLAIINNDAFAHLCQSAIPVRPHIALDTATKTVKPGALWHEESLPPDTVLYTCLSVKDSRRPSCSLSGEDLYGALSKALLAKHPYLQLGGNETTGMGWCKVTEFAWGAE